MAACSKSEGYKCEFIDTVTDLFRCKKCSLVARKMTATSCCGESYCHPCIADIHQQGKPCPECGESFNIYEQLKYQKLIGALRAYCSMKERGCDWSGTLEQLDTHLDPDQDNCQYVDIKCPLCQKAIPKIKVEQHVADECIERPYVCQHCNFKATYEEVVNTHLPECKYIPLDCPNGCGVTCEREDVEDHMKICRLEEIACKFEAMGCNAKLPREDCDSHAIQNIQEHLLLVASEVAIAKEKFQQNLMEQEQKYQLQEKKLQQQEQKLLEMERKDLELKLKILEQEQKIQDQDNKLRQLQLEQKFLEQNKILQDLQNTQKLQKQKLEEQGKSLQAHAEFFPNYAQRFEVRSIERKMKERRSERSPPIYTHVKGYKFVFEIAFTTSESIIVSLHALPGKFDADLEWPANVRFTFAILDQNEGNDKEFLFNAKWDKPKQETMVQIFCWPLTKVYGDTLFFCVRDISY